MLLNIGNLSGGGIISANGADGLSGLDGSGGAGGGGRIAVYSWGENSFSSKKIVANGGADGEGEGEDGTVVVTDAL